ncbi:cytochrome P450 [Streptomyces platensis]|uniref:cytochrome P450 n=1 Tax=Streptomyces platensis TaxID=58346 RepID=UPI002E821854|nr:cytochrome P450 [Streptomyces platensis]WTI56080.1 cytochrome P450 [Streptomyces platensis]WUB78399.1 cytochrome P450 [Streptomyces platensis]
MTEAADPPFPNFPMPRECPFRPPAGYTELRAERPVSQVTLPSGNNAWVISDYALVREFLADSRTSANRAHPSYPSVLPRQPVSSQQAKGLLTWMDPPEHTAHRRMVVNEFTAKRVAAMGPHIRAITEDCIDQMLLNDRSADLVQSLSLPVPSRVICELLGVPYSDRELFDKRTVVILNHQSAVEDRMAAWQELRSYLSDLVSVKVQAPEDDLLSRLVKKYQDAGTFDHELLTGLAVALLVAGHETTANMISLGTVFLLDNPDRIAELREHPEHAGQMVEELLRYFSIADYSTSRVTTSDIEIGGVVIPGGSGVIALNSAANNDEKIFAAPEEFNAHRDARRHMAFGYGIHQCLGQSLARLELEIVFTTLFRRIPDLRLTTPSAQLSYKHNAAFYGIYEVPVAW